MHPTGSPLDPVFVVAAGVAVVLMAVRCSPALLLAAFAPMVPLLTLHQLVGVVAAVVGVAAAVAVGTLRVRAWPSVQRSIASSSVGVALCAGAVSLDDLGVSRLSAAAAAVSVLLVGIGWWRTLQPTVRRRLWIGAGAVVVITAVSSGVAYLAANTARRQVLAAQDLVERAEQAVRAGDEQSADRLLVEARGELATAIDAIDAPWVYPSRVVPIVGNNVNATANVIHSVDRAVGALVETSRRVDLSSIGIRDGRVDLESVDRLASTLTVSVDALDHVRGVVADSRSPWLVDQVAQRLDTLAAQVDRLGSNLTNARDVLRILPAMLGGDGDRRYLVVFTTTSEARGGGGFPGQTAELTFRDGALSLGVQRRSSDLRSPEGQPWVIEGADEYLARYVPFRVDTDWRNITMSPDWPTVAGVARQAYSQTTGTPIDGVLRLGPRAIVALLGVTGPVDVVGLDQPLDEANAYEFLVRGQYTQAFASDDDRVEFLGRAVDAVVTALVQRDLGSPVVLVEALGDVVKANELSVWSAVDTESDVLHRLSVDGAVPSLDTGDSLWVTQHNLLTNKIDSFAQVHIEPEVVVDTATRTVQGTLTVTLTNNASADDPEVLVGSDPRRVPLGTMRELLTIYTEHTLDDFRVDGRPVAVTLQPEFGRHAYVVQVEVPPGGRGVVTATVSGTYRPVDGHYRLVMPVVAAVNPMTATVSVNGTKVDHTFTRPLAITTPH